MSISCIIVDDEPYAGNLLEEYILQVPYLRLEKKCLTAMEALDFLQGQVVDLVFLDINLPQLSGMQLAHILPRNQKVIFTTAYTSYAVESYAINAIDYLLKPITFERFLKSIEKIHGVIKRPAEQGNFFIKSGKAMIKVSASDIYYIEGLKDYVIFRLEKEKHIVYKKMKELEAILEENFMRIHHSFIVNTNHIKKIEDNQVHILDQRISISEKYRESFIGFIKNKLM
jgi:two-component system, LytTR family, response regulator